MAIRSTHFITLDLTVPLAWGQKYNDDGYVSDIAEYLAQKRFALTPASTPEIQKAWVEKYRSDYQGHPGITIKIEKSKLLWDEEEIRIAYLDLKEDLANTYVRGRQETDALRELGQLKLLEERVKTRGVFSRFELENILDLGGIYALFKKEYTSKEISFYAHGKERMSYEIRSALRIFTQNSTQKKVPAILKK
ncbi:MAG TPA: hypothetical protein VJB13_00950 [Candidatus Nanoarchaeia archaeon]|nr:hypothetical protein [Candidatus Nanoarchaeia archaeon]